MKSKESSEYIKGTIKTIVLKLLTDHTKMYGYEITQKVKALSGGEIELTYGALYPILYKLEKDQLVISESEIVEGRVRKYYSLTRKGGEQALQKVAELNKFIQVIYNVIGGSPQPTVPTWAI